MNEAESSAVVVGHVVHCFEHGEYIAGYPQGQRNGDRGAKKVREGGSFHVLQQQIGALVVASVTEATWNASGLELSVQPRFPLKGQHRWFMPCGVGSIRLSATMVPSARRARHTSPTEPVPMSASISRPSVVCWVSCAMVAQYDPENRILLCYNPWRVMQHKLSTMAAVFMPAVLLLAADAHAARLAVVALPSPHGQAPVEEADALTSHLIKRRHRTIASADATERLLSGNAGAGPDWAAGLSGEVRRGREALTRLDRHAADLVRREVQESIERMGGGAGGAQVLVEWALLESALASSAGDGTRATRWIDKAATLGPTVVLDPLVHPETERQAFQDATDRVREAGEGTLTVVTVPASAELWVDGVRRCRTPCTASLPPGQHFARVTSPAHAPAVLSVQLASDQSASRRVGLTSAYTGASIEAIEAMLDNPSRASEAQSSLSALADFLDVDHVVVLRRTSNQLYSIRVAPVLEGNDAVRSGLSESVLAASADAMLQPVRSVATQDGAWYESSALWVGVASVAVVAVGAGLLLSRGDDSAPPSHGTLVIGGR